MSINFKKLAFILKKLQAAGHAVFPPESFPISNYGSGQSQLYAWQRLKTISTASIFWQRKKTIAHYIKLLLIDQTNR